MRLFVYFTGSMIDASVMGTVHRQKCFLSIVITLILAAYSLCPITGSAKTRYKFLFCIHFSIPLAFYIFWIYN